MGVLPSTVYLGFAVGRLRSSIKNVERSCLALQYYYFMTTWVAVALVGTGICDMACFKFALPFRATQASGGETTGLKLEWTRFWTTTLQEYLSPVHGTW